MSLAIPVPARRRPTIGAAFGGAALLVLPLLLFLAAVYLLPVGDMLLRSLFDPNLTFRHYGRIADSRIYLLVIANTFRLALTVTIGTLVVAYPAAYYMTTVGAGRLQIVLFLILVPFWTSILVRTYGWMVLLGRQGVVNHLLLGAGVVDQPLQLMFNPWVVHVAMLQILLPFMILPLYATMRGIDETLLDAAAGLGASRFNVFLKVFLPLCLPGVLAGSLLVFVLSLGFFITPALLGGRGDITIAMLILQQFSASLDWGFGAALSSVLLALALLAIGLLARLVRSDPAEAQG